MLTHDLSSPQTPHRLVVIGAKGFVGNAVVTQARSQKIDVLPLGREDIDLTAAGAAESLADRMQPTDTVIAISAKAPVKSHDMIAGNIAMADTLCAAISKIDPTHVIYVSSDAVYRDSDQPMTEAHCAEPGSLHGAMHRSRELMLETVQKNAYAIIRPTLIYGMGDPHNGYGPNMFRRLAVAGSDITLFGQGEERRDHVHVDDVAALILAMATHRSRGILNAATGVVTSFMDIAKATIDAAGTGATIQSRPRSGPMPHNGYRAFDPAATAAAFPNFTYMPLMDGIAATVKAEQAAG